MTRPFKHYIITRFNMGLYAPNAGIRVTPQEWMDHRMRLFTTITLPSIVGQSCAEFTWLLGMDAQTPDRYIQEIESFRIPNLKIVYTGDIHPVWAQGFEPGDYDLITTRLDNDDALHRDAVVVLHKTYLRRRQHQRIPWVIVFPLGLIVDVSTREFWPMEYWFNSCPTLVEDSREPVTVQEWDHCCIPAHVQRCFVKDQPYWLQVVHSQNVLNKVPVDHPNKRVYGDMPMPMEALGHFNVAARQLLALQS